MAPFHWADIFSAHILDVHLPNVLVGIGASIEIPLITTVGRRVGAVPSQIANFVLLSSACRTVLDIPFGVVVEYVGVRNVMLACLIVNVAAALLGTRISDFYTLGLFCAMCGTSLGGFFLSRHIFVAGISSKKYRGLLMSFLSGLLRWSHVIGPLVTGIIASRTGDTRNAFYVAAAASFIAFACITVTVCSASYQQQCEHSCTPSAAQTPCETDADDEGAATATATGSDGGAVAVAVPPLAGVGAVCDRGSSGSHSHCSAAPAGVVHPSLGAEEEHYFHISAVWFTLVDYWTVIWRLGVYIVVFGALRSNRKLMIMLAGMREEMNDAQVSYLLSFSFIFDALLFPLGGIIMDFMGRQFAMAPVAVGLGLVFFILPFCRTHVTLYMASSAFGIADAMGCGLIMTLTADRAPKVYGAPFFGIMRTLADLGHVVGAGGVSFLVKRVGHDQTCFVLAATGILTALWGVFIVPRDTEPLETPRLNKAVEGTAKGRGKARPDGHQRLPDGELEERPLLGGAAARRPFEGYGSGATQ